MMKTTLENFASKKFGVILAAGYVLWDASEKHPDNALVYLCLLCGMSVVYSGLEIMDKWLEKKNSVESTHA